MLCVCLLSVLPDQISPEFLLPNARKCVKCEVCELVISLQDEMNGSTCTEKLKVLFYFRQSSERCTAALKRKRTASPPS